MATFTWAQNNLDTTWPDRHTWKLKVSTSFDYAIAM
jgi:hypothetical protein